MKVIFIDDQSFLLWQHRCWGSVRRTNYLQTYRSLIFLFETGYFLSGWQYPASPAVS